MHGDVVNAHPQDHGKAHEYGVNQTFTFVLRHDVPPKISKTLAVFQAARDIIAEKSRLRK
jgi:hypothetical protein